MKVHRGTGGIVSAVFFLAASAGSAGSAGPKAVPVPPTLEIEVLDPNVDPVGNPAAFAVSTAAGRARIDIPQTVLVHKYYYTGDRSFQAGMLPGGPTIVVVNHPKTGERLYVPVQMLPGAPRVTYTSRSIAYDFGNQTILIKLCALTCRADVVYSHQLVNQETWDKVKDAKTKVKNLVERSGLPACHKRVVNATRDAAVTAVDRMHGLGTLVITPVLQVGRMIPGANLLSSTPEDRAVRLRDAKIEQLQPELERKDITIPINE